MTVKETIIVCQILNDMGYGDYQMTCESGYDYLGKFPDYIDKDKKNLNMEGSYPPSCRNIRECQEIATICEKIKDVLDKGMY